jgi:hypothetical protein
LLLSFGDDFGDFVSPAKADATTDVVKLVRQQVSPKFLGNFRSAYFPGQIPGRLAIA